MGNAIMLNKEKKAEFIETIITGYELLTEQPDDWKTAFTSYYIKGGTAENPTYTAITGSTAPTWEIGKFFYLDTATNNVSRTAEPDGTPYSFSALYFYITSETSISSTNIHYEYPGRWSNCVNAFINFSKSAIYRMEIRDGVLTGAIPATDTNQARAVTKVIFLDRLTAFQLDSIPAKTTIKIYGVRT